MTRRLNGVDSPVVIVPVIDVVQGPRRYSPDMLAIV